MLATFLGLLAPFPRRLPLIMGFAAGVLIGTVCFELLPEMMRHSAEAGGARRHGRGGHRFLLFHALEVVIIHHHQCGFEHRHLLGAFSALASPRPDGVGIGLASGQRRRRGARGACRHLP